MKNKFFEILTDKEIEVMDVLIRGCTNQEIADVLFRSEKTVRFHLTNIFKKTGIKNRSALIVRYLEVKDEISPRAEQLNKAVAFLLRIGVHNFYVKEIVGVDSQVIDMIILNNYMRDIPSNLYTAVRNSP